MPKRSAALAGRAAIVTGGAGGLGCASACALARDGASVTLMGRSADALERARDAVAAVAAAGAEVRTAAGDALVVADLERALDVAVEGSTHGGLDVFVATVGGGDVRPLMQHDPESFAADLRVNIVSAFMAIRYGAPRMQAAGGGSIVCVSSTAAVLPWPLLAGYTTGKAGVEALVRTAAAELGPAGIRVNAVRPGLTRTSATQGMFGNPALLDRFVANKPLGRAGEPEDVAAAIRFLAGPEASWLTGQSFAIDGGNELTQAVSFEPELRAALGDEAMDAALLRTRRT